MSETNEEKPGRRRFVNSGGLTRPNFQIQRLPDLQEDDLDPGNQDGDDQDGDDQDVIGLDLLGEGDLILPPPIQDQVIPQLLPPQQRGWQISMKKPPEFIQEEDIPEDAKQWTLEMLQALGWQSKKVEHAKISSEIGGMLDTLPRTKLTNSARLQQGKLTGKLQRNGAWNSVDEMQATQLKATLNFESMPGKLAQPQTGSANPTFWVKNASDPQTNETREYIFKPGLMKADMPGIPEGGEPAREALAGRVAEKLSVFTGLDLNMPNTNLIEVETERLSGFQSQTPMTPGNDGATFGSLQAFAPSTGDLRDGFYAERGNIVAQDCQNIALLDTVILNLDRHNGNLLKGAQGGLIPIDHGLSFPDSSTVEEGVLQQNLAGEKNVLLKIPSAYEPFSQESLAGIDRIDPDLLTMALRQDATTMEQVHPNTEGMISNEALSLSNLSTRFLKRAAPLLSPAVLQIALGANSKRLLNPAALENLPEWEVLADQIIQDYATKTASLKEYFMLGLDERDAIGQELARAKIWPGDRPDPEWLFQSIDTVMAFVRGGGRMPRPDKPRAIAPMLPDIDRQTALDQFKEAVPEIERKKIQQDCIDAWAEIRPLGGYGAVKSARELRGQQKFKTPGEVVAAVKQLVKAEAAQRQQQKLLYMMEAFPDMPPPVKLLDVKNAIEDYQRFVRNGGMKALKLVKEEHFPGLPYPQEPRAALLMLLSTPPAPEQIVLKRLDYLDQIVEADPNLVSQTNQQAIGQMRIDVNGNALDDPKAAVDLLADEVIGEALARGKQRLLATERRQPEQNWIGLKAVIMPLFDQGNILIALKDLGVRERELPLQDIR